MIPLQPQEQFTIVRQLGDHTDSSTYYVQAVVRNSIDDTILKTINLTDKGSRRFKALYEVPADISGMGFYIDITTSVYTDSGYTIKSTAYSDENDSYLVFDRIVGAGGGGGGMDVDYKRIETMLSKSQGSIIKALPEEHEVDLSPIMSELSDLRISLNRLDANLPKEVTLQPILTSLAGARTAIMKLVADTATDPTDLTPVLSAIIENAVSPEQLTAIEQAIREVKRSVETFIDYLPEEKAGDPNHPKKKVDKVRTTVQSLLGIMPKEPATEAPQAKPNDRVQRLLG